MRATIVAALLAVALTACASRAQPSTGAGLPVVTTTTVFAEMVSRVGGDRVFVHSLVPRGTDVHTFDPTPAAIQALSTARLLVMNGLGLDDWLTSVIRDVGAANTPLLKVGESVAGAQLIANDQAQGGGSNPHLWMDVTYARAYAAATAAQLIQLDPANKQTYDANLAAYDTELRDLDAWIRGQLGSLPPDSRRIVSFHDAFAYYARAYGLEIIGVVLPAPGQDPSAGEIAALVNQIRNSHVKAVLAEAQFDDRLVRTIADETGVKVVQDLYDDALGGSITSYEELMRFDTNQLTVALK